MKDNDKETDFFEFCGWYRCRKCGVNERFIPPMCPVCGRTVTNYPASQTEKLRAAMLERRAEE